MRWIKSFFIAFSIFSKIPVPQFEWKEKEMKYMICFFPWIGAVIGAIYMLWCMCCRYIDMGALAFTCISVAIPLILTGGFHVDGFMDSMDAFHSWQPKERKLEILKDSHIGAFSVIMLATWGLVYVGAMSAITDIRVQWCVALGFFLSRTLSGIAVVSFSKAKKDGLASTFSNGADEKRSRLVLILEGLVCVVFFVVFGGFCGAIVCVTAGIVFWWYYCKTKKLLGGITGDTAGYFVVTCEVCMAVVAAIINIIG